MNKISFKLEKYRLNKINFTLNSSKIKNKRISIKQKIISTHSDLTEEKISIFLNVFVTCAIFKIEVEYEGYFSFNAAFASADIEIKEKIIHVNCTATLFPFARELIAETTRRADLMPLVLPSQNFVTAYKKCSDCKDDLNKEQG